MGLFDEGWIMNRELTDQERLGLSVLYKAAGLHFRFAYNPRLFPLIRWKRLKYGLGARTTWSCKHPPGVRVVSLEEVHAALLELIKEETKKEDNNEQKGSSHHNG